MSVDGSLIALVASIAIPALGVVATLLAPRLTRSARVAYEVDYLYLVRTETAPRKLTIEVFHDGKKVDHPVYAFSGNIMNAGGRDLTKDDFVNPIQLLAAPGVEILSAEVKGASGIGPITAYDSKKLDLTWAILKPKEKVEVRGILQVERNASRKEQEFDFLNVVARLRDVQIGKGWLSRLNVRAAALTFLAMFALLVGLGTWVDYPSKSLYLPSVSGEPERQLTIKDGEFQACRDAFDGIGGCKRLTREETADILPKLQERQTVELLKPWFLGASALIALAYALLVLCMPLFLRRVKAIVNIVRQLPRRDREKA